MQLTTNLVSLLLLAQLAFSSPARTRKRQRDSVEHANVLLPTEEELKTMSLGDLVNRRPSDTRGIDGENFAKLFAKHHKIAALDHTKMTLEEYTEGWSKLRSEQKGKYRGNRLFKALQYHLEEVAKVDDTTKSTVFGHWTGGIVRENNQRNSARFRARMSPQERLDHNKYKSERKVLANKRKFELGGLSAFASYMEELGIAHRLNPTKLEEESRKFIDRYENPSIATSDLKRYMKKQNYKPFDRIVAVGNRRRYLIKGNINRRKRKKRKGVNIGRPQGDQQAAGTSTSRLDSYPAYQEVIAPAESRTPRTVTTQDILNKYDWWDTSRL